MLRTDTKESPAAQQPSSPNLIRKDKNQTKVRIKIHHTTTEMAEVNGYLCMLAKTWKH